MALTQTQIPQDYTPAYNDQFITYISDSYATTGFKYQIDILINGETTTKLLSPRPDGYMVFNLKETVKNYIDRSYFNPDSVTLEVATDKSVLVDVTITEYGVSPADSDNFTYNAWDACLKDSNFRAFDFNTIVPAPEVSLLSTNQLELTYPDNRVTLDTDVWIHYVNNDSNKVKLSVFDENSNPQGIVELDITSDIDVINYANVGAKTLLAQSPPITPQVGWTVEVDILKDASTLFSTSYGFTEICTKHIDYILYYLKRNGNIGFFHFEQLSQEEETKKTNTVRLDTNKLVSGVFQSNVYDREVHTVSTETVKTITLNTNWITEAQSAALNELFDSPIVWMQRDGGDYIPIEIKDTTYTYKKHVNEKVFNYSIKAEYSVKETRQRGL